MSLAALIGIDARVLLTTDDPATHEVYDRVVIQSVKWSMERAMQDGRNQAIHNGNMLIEIFAKGK